MSNEKLLPDESELNDKGDVHYNDVPTLRWMMSHLRRAWRAGKADSSFSTDVMNDWMKLNEPLVNVQLEELVTKSNLTPASVEQPKQDELIGKQVTFNLVGDKWSGTVIAFDKEIGKHQIQWGNGGTFWMRHDEFKLKEPEQERALRELLAVLHRDGGHYTAEHGLLKSCEDAQALLHKEWILKEPDPVETAKYLQSEGMTLQDYAEGADGKKK